MKSHSGLWWSLCQNDQRSCLSLNSQDTSSTSRANQTFCSLTALASSITTLLKTPLVLIIYPQKGFQHHEVSADCCLPTWNDATRQQDFSALNWSWIIHLCRHLLVGVVETEDTPIWTFSYINVVFSICNNSPASSLPFSFSLRGVFVIFSDQFSPHYFALAVCCSLLSLALFVGTVFPWHLVKTAFCMQRGPTIFLIPL